VSRPRDTYRQRVYDAEDAAFRDYGVDLPELRDVRTYVARVREHPDVQASYARARRAVAVRDGRGRRRAGGSPERGISMPCWSRKRWVVLHELAHVFADPPQQQAWHGEDFVATYVDLVDTMLGEDAARRLVEELNARNVPWTKART
jgi:putative metallohydrolase (TIGR04338 family)